MMTTENAIKIHDILIERYGGAKGIRDKNLLESALSRPYQTFDRKELYNTTVEKAAALIESIITNHPFLDGNKRFGYVAMRLLLLEEGLDIEAKEDEKYIFVIAIAEGKLKYSDICDWIKKYLKQ
jgi:death-on-curing protein